MQRTSSLSSYPSVMTYLWDEDPLLGSTLTNALANVSLEKDYKYYAHVSVLYDLAAATYLASSTFSTLTDNKTKLRSIVNMYYQHIAPHRALLERHLRYRIDYSLLSDVQLATDMDVLLTLLSKIADLTKFDSSSSSMSLSSSAQLPSSSLLPLPIVTTTSKHFTDMLELSTTIVTNANIAIKDKVQTLVELHTTIERYNKEYITSRTIYDATIDQYKTVITAILSKLNLAKLPPQFTTVADVREYASTFLSGIAAWIRGEEQKRLDQKKIIETLQDALSSTNDHLKLPSLGGTGNLSQPFTSADIKKNPENLSGVWTIWLGIQTNDSTKGSDIVKGLLTALESIAKFVGISDVRTIANLKDIFRDHSDNVNAVNTETDKVRDAVQKYVRVSDKLDKVIDTLYGSCQDLLVAVTRNTSDRIPKRNSTEDVVKLVQTYLEKKSTLDKTMVEQYQQLLSSLESLTNAIDQSSITINIKVSDTVGSSTTTIRMPLLDVIKRLKTASATVTNLTTLDMNINNLPYRETDHILNSGEELNSLVSSAIRDQIILLNNNNTESKKRIEAAIDDMYSNLRHGVRDLGGELGVLKLSSAFQSNVQNAVAIYVRNVSEQVTRLKELVSASITLRRYISTDPLTTATDPLATATDLESEISTSLTAIDLKYASLTLPSSTPLSSLSSASSLSSTPSTNIPDLSGILSKLKNMDTFGVATHAMLVKKKTQEREINTASASLYRMLHDNSAMLDTTTNFPSATAEKDAITAAIWTRLQTHAGSISVKLTRLNHLITASETLGTFVASPYINMSLLKEAITNSLSFYDKAHTTMTPLNAAAAAVTLTSMILIGTLLPNLDKFGTQTHKILLEHGERIDRLNNITASLHKKLDNNSSMLDKTNVFPSPSDVTASIDPAVESRIINTAVESRIKTWKETLSKKLTHLNSLLSSMLTLGQNVHLDSSKVTQLTTLSHLITTTNMTLSSPLSSTTSSSPDINLIINMYGTHMDVNDGINAELHNAVVTQTAHVSKLNTAITSLYRTLYDNSSMLDKTTAFPSESAPVEEISRIVGTRTEAFVKRYHDKITNAQAMLKSLKTIGTAFSLDVTTIDTATSTDTLDKILPSINTALSTFTPNFASKINTYKTAHDKYKETEKDVRQTLQKVVTRLTSAFPGKGSIIISQDTNISKEVDTLINDSVLPAFQEISTNTNKAHTDIIRIGSLMGIPPASNIDSMPEATRETIASFGSILAPEVTQRKATLGLTVVAGWSKINAIMDAAKTRLQQMQLQQPQLQQLQYLINQLNAYQKEMNQYYKLPYSEQYTYVSQLYFFLSEPPGSESYVTFKSLIDALNDLHIITTTIDQNTPDFALSHREVDKRITAQAEEVDKRITAWSTVAKDMKQRTAALTKLVGDIDVQKYTQLTTDSVDTILEAYDKGVTVFLLGVITKFHGDPIPLQNAIHTCLVHYAKVSKDISDVIARIRDKRGFNIIFTPNLSEITILQSDNVLIMFTNILHNNILPSINNCRKLLVDTTPTYVPITWDQLLAQARDQLLAQAQSVTQEQIQAQARAQVQSNALQYAYILRYIVLAMLYTPAKISDYATRTFDYEEHSNETVATCLASIIADLIREDRKTLKRVEKQIDSSLASITENTYVQMPYNKHVDFNMLVTPEIVNNIFGSKDLSTVVLHNPQRSIFSQIPTPLELPAVSLSDVSDTSKRQAILSPSTPLLPSTPLPPSTPAQSPGKRTVSGEPVLLSSSTQTPATTPTSLTSSVTSRFGISTITGPPPQLAPPATTSTSPFGTSTITVPPTTDTEMRSFGTGIYSDDAF